MSEIPAYTLSDGLDVPAIALVHWPNPKRGLYVEAFQALLDARDRGLIRSVGVCNFLPEHLDRVHAETGEYPSVNQIELHPYFPQASALAYHAQVGMLTESWSPLGRKWRIVEDPAIVALASEVGVSPSRLILRWHYQLGTMPLPKSGNPERQRENLDIFSFSLSDEQMAAISALGRPDGRQADQNPEYRSPHASLRLGVVDLEARPCPPDPPAPSTPVVPGVLTCGSVRVVTNVVNPRCFLCGFLSRCYKRRQFNGFFGENAGFWA